MRVSLLLLTAPAAAGAAPACGGPCNDGVHICDPQAECSLCIPSPTSNTTFHCLAGCGNKCTADAHCGSVGCGKCVSGACT
eukprot:gene10951-14276_t